MLFNTDIVKFVWKTDEAESIVLLIFVFWRCLNLRWRGGGVGQNVLFRASGNRIFFQPVFLTFKSNLNLNAKQRSYFFYFITYHLISSRP